MKINELRIGNWLLFRNMIHPNSFTQVCPRFFSSFSIEDNLTVSNYYQPIPLTEEILLKCGFEKIDNLGLLHYQSLKFKEFKIYYLNNEELNSYYIALKNNENDNSFFIKPQVNYLHQLQNIYWCLCAEELEINL